jgi:CheY-like chemotaxis protein
MNVSGFVEQQLPYLRRYARAVTGAASQGDVAVEAMLEALFTDPPEAATRTFLFQALDRTLDSVTRRKPPESFSSQGQRALLLTALEGFSTADAAAILGVTEGSLPGLMESAETSLAKLSGARVAIIEDEPLIAASLSQILQSLGHTVTSISATRTDAVAHALAERPDLILADIQLADDSQGSDAVADIRAVYPVPVIYITAFPERLLTGKPGEPTFLIPKPFKPAHVRAIVTQALFFRTLINR